MIRDAKGGAEKGSEAEEVEDAEEAQGTEENRSWCLPAARFFFDDVMFSRIALTTLARSAGVAVVLKYRKGPGERTSEDNRF